MALDQLCPDEAVLEQFLLGRSSGSEALALETHLATCERCAARAESMQPEDDLIATMRERSPILSTTDHSSLDQLAQRVQERTAGMAEGWSGASSTNWAEEISLAPAEAAGEIGRLHGYRVLKILGTGGMGVVYLARDDRLKRQVALKLIPPGPRVTPARLERFRREAELIARVRHANVVQLHEVGDWQQSPQGPIVPYIVMEYVAGGTLAERLAVGPVAPGQAAEWLLALAQGVYEVHQQGVIHRDLKPSNVLLEGASSVPKISDFGLARALDVGSADGVTVSGAILGTPSYMPPEQAGGSDEEVTPASDVYALGAVLYEALTGRPPFRGATTLETLEQVRHQEPVPPNTLRPGVPRDLSIICLKCLEKDPRRRYPSASDLADDVQRYLEGRPILARPAGILDRLLKWVRRRPVVALLSGLCLLFVAALLVGAAVYESRLRKALGRTEGALELARTEGERADANYRKARDTIQQILRSANNPRWSGLPRMLQLKQQQIEAALLFYEEIARQTGDSPLVQADVAAACLEVARFLILLGRKQAAIPKARLALEKTEDLLRRQPESVSVWILRHEARRVLATALANDQSVAYLEQSISELEQFLQNHPGSGVVRGLLASGHISLGAAYQNQRKFPQALRCAVRSVEVTSELVRENPGGHEQRSFLAQARINLASAYHALAQHDRARRQQNLAEIAFEDLLIQVSDHNAAIEGLAALRVNIAYGVAERQGFQAALAYVSRNVPLLESALKREPDDALFRDRLARTHGLRAVLLDKQERFGEAAKAWEQMMALMSREEAERSRGSLAHLLVRAGDHARGAEELALVVKNLKSTLVADHWKLFASIYEEAVTAASKDTRLSPEKRLECQKRYRAAAQAALIEAKKPPKREPKKPNDPNVKKP